MPIQFPCPRCNKQLKVSSAHIGKRAKCSQCEHQLTIPDTRHGNPNQPPIYNDGLDEYFDTPSTPEAQRRKPLQPLSSGFASNLDPLDADPLGLGSLGAAQGSPSSRSSSAGGLPPQGADLFSPTFAADDFDFKSPPPRMNEDNPFAAPQAYDSPRSQTGPSGGKYAGFGARFAALVIDRIILALLGFLLGAIIGIAAISGSGAVSPGLLIAINLASIVLEAAYFIVLTASASQGTFGKRMIGIKVTDLSGHPIGLARSTGRFFATILSALFLLMGFLMQPFTTRKQALHDMIAGTVVVRS